jgi:hypothetical protein
MGLQGASTWWYDGGVLQFLGSRTTKRRVVARFGASRCSMDSMAPRMPSKTQVPRARISRALRGCEARERDERVRALLAYSQCRLCEMSRSPLLTAT